MSYAPGFADVARGPAISTASLMGGRLRGFVAALPVASVAWPTANMAYAVPFELGAPITLRDLFWISGTSPGTAAIDLGIYDENFKLMASIGATAATNTTDVLQPAGGAALASPLTLGRGRYYMAMSAAAITITTRAITYSNGMLKAMGVMQMAAAHPLPATFVPAALGTAILPTFGAAQVANLL